MNTKLKWTLGIAGSLVVGALGSGLWNGVFSPIFTATGHFGLSLITLGYSSTRDLVYERAAVGMHEEASVLGLVFLVSFSSGLPIVLYLPIRRAIKKIFKKDEERSENKNVAEQKKEIERFKRKALLLARTSFWATIVSVCLGTIIFVQILLLSYTNQIIAHYNQELAIITPDITEQQRQIYQARFASMKTRQDFVSLFEEINKTAESHGKPQSTFIPW
jgi:hypothetical protein